MEHLSNQPSQSNKNRLLTDFCLRFGTQYPIIQAGMAGGITTPQLVAAVSEAGGLGTLGGAYMSPGQIREAIRMIRQLTRKPFGVNLFAAEIKDDLTRADEVQGMLDPIRHKLGLPDGMRHLQSPDWFEEQLQVLLEEEVPVISTAFGILPPDAMREAQRAGQLVIGMVTTVREAVLAEQCGVDAVVAQGSDAGGHRGTFRICEHPSGANIGTFSLVPQIVDHISIPVIAAGGIMDGRGLAAAIMLGAQGVQMGTRFLTAKEAGTHPKYREALLNSTEEDTVITKAFSGRPARGLRNLFIDHVESSGVQPLPFPTQNTATGDIRRAAAAQDNADYMSLWAGQATRLLTANDSAATIVSEVIAEADAALHGYDKMV